MNPNELSMVVRAMTFAADKHKNQRRKDVAASPYINHPIGLVDVLVHEGGITDVAILAAALLHDTIEDTETTADEIESEFGALVCSIVLEVTDDKRLDKQARKQMQIEKAPDLSVEARAVKLADKICNLRDVICSPPRGWEVERCDAYIEWAKAVIDGLRGHHPKLEAVFDSTYASAGSRSD